MIKKIQKITAHKPVLVTEVLEYLNIRPGKTYLDVTFGSGGHSRAILEQNPDCTVVAMDWDIQTLEKYAAPLQEEFKGRFFFFWGNFAHLYRHLKKYNISTVDGILADFGTSQMQILQTPGISFAQDTPLDMRLSPSHQAVTAADVVNKSPEQKLTQIFLQLGQEVHARKIVRAIIKARAQKKIITTGQLVEIIESIIPYKKKGIHPATKIFQALRIYVNHELDNIQSFLPAALQALNPEGRLVCISFHSLEDRMVKQYFKDEEMKQTCKLLTQKAIVASEQEIAQNPSARSAKLRAAEKL